jgi:hypothetical protein
VRKLLIARDLLVIWYILYGCVPIRDDPAHVPPQLPAFEPELARIATRMRAHPLPSRADTESFREALCDYVRVLRVEGIAREQVVAAVWPALVGIASPRVAKVVVDWCLAAYDGP